MVFIIGDKTYISIIISTARVIIKFQIWTLKRTEFLVFKKWRLYFYEIIEFYANSANSWYIISNNINITMAPKTTQIIIFFAFFILSDFHWSVRNKNQE
jgi:hypothetical protein